MLTVFEFSYLHIRDRFNGEDPVISKHGCKGAEDKERSFETSFYNNFQNIKCRLFLEKVLVDCILIRISAVSLLLECM